MYAQRATTSLLTPIEGSALNKAITDVISARNLWPINPEIEWRCLETLYLTCLGLKKGTQELIKQIEPVLDDLEKIEYPRNSTFSRLNAEKSVTGYKKMCNSKIYRAIMLFLRDNNYGEIATGATPLNVDQPHMGLNPK